MIHYKSYRIINGKPKWVIIDEDDNIINDPIDEQRKMAILEDSVSYRRNKFKGRKCCVCGEIKTYMKSPDSPLWYKCACGMEYCTGFLCNNCSRRAYQKNDPNSNNNIIKNMADSRIGNLDPNSPPGKGFIGVHIVAKTLMVDDCNIKMNNFRFYIDLSRHCDYGLIEVKTATMKNGKWIFTGLEREFDTLFLVCMDENYPWKSVKSMYAIPWEYAVRRKNITIVDNPSRTVWYEKFRIDEKSFDDTYHNMKLDRCTVLRKNNKK